MIRPLWLEVQEFRGWRARQRLPLERRLTIVVAENRCGKSSTLNAIEWCLFGARVEKAASGLGERADWEVRPRTAGESPTEVTLALATAAGEVQICRRRPGKPKAGKGDELSVRLSDASTVTGQAAERWLAEQGLSDWEGYRRAHCFHQEAARPRVLEKQDRSAILAGLLGLREDRQLRETLAKLRAGEFMRDVDDVLADLNTEVQKAVWRPQQQLVTLEQRLLTQWGLQRWQVGPALEAQVAQRLLDRAEQLAVALGISVSPPAAGNVDAVLQWAGAWPGTVRASATVLQALPGLRRRSGELATALALATPAEAAWRLAESAVTAEVAIGGDEAQRTQRQQAAEAALAQAESARKAAHAVAALLKDAQRVLAAGAIPDRCPVCDSAAPDLAARLQASLADYQSQTLVALSDARDAARTTRDDAERALQDLRRLLADRNTAKSVWDQHRAGLLRHLPAPVPAHVLAAANAEHTRLEAGIRRLEQVESARDTSLKDHAADSSLLQDLRDWKLASQAVQTPVELGALPAWADLQRAIDAASAYASDVECLEEVARAAQAERSAAREQEVNRTLGEYFAAITGTTDASGVRVHVNPTPKGLDYQLRDATGEAAVPVMNQAAINALSLAALFAQAEDAAAQGGLAWVVLDDPVQSLDEAHQQGLAEAVRRLSEHCHVLIAAVPSPLVERLRTHVPVERRFLFLGPWQTGVGSAVAREDVL